MSGTDTTTEHQIDISDDLDAFGAAFYGQKAAEPTETKVEAEQETDDKDPVAPEVQKDDPDPNEDPEAEYKEAAPKKKTVQDRIDELVKQREDVKRDADAQIAAVRREFEEKLAALQPKAPAAAEKPEPNATDLKADGTPKYELGEFDPQYIRDLTRHTLEVESEKVAQLRVQQDQQRVQQEAQQQLQTTWNGKIEAATKEYPDLVEKGQALLNGFGNLPSDYAGYLSTVLMSMDKGPDVLYYLSNNPAEAAAIVNSGAQKATLALGRIEAKFLDADAQKQLAKPKITQAPVPPKVQARGTNGAFISVAPDTDDLDAFAREFYKKK